MIKTISAAIRQAHSVLSLPSPTTGIHPAPIRTAAKRRLGVRVKNVKAPWQWAHLVDFTSNMCSVSTSAPMWITGLLAAASFASFGRFSCLAELTWKYVDLSDPEQVTVFFDKRKNDQFREGSSVVIPRVTDAGLDLPNLFLQWKTRSPATGDDDFVFMDFPLTASAQCLDADVHVNKAISYAKYRKALSLWMAPYVGSLNAQAFLSIFGNWDQIWSRRRRLSSV